MGIWNDLSHAARMLVRERGFAAVAILSVALGVGANTAIFSIVNGVLLKPMPFADPDRLVALREVVPAMARTYPTLPVSARHFTEWRQRASSFEDIAASQPGAAALTGAGEPERIDTVRVSANLFDALGVKPALGRAFAEREDEPGSARVVVLSDSLWRRRFNADPSVLGKSIQLDSQPHTVIGVLPGWFEFPNAHMLETGRVATARPEAFYPLVFNAGELKMLMGNFNYTVLARLKRGVSPEKAGAELNVIAGQIVEMSGEKIQLRAAVIPMRDALVGKSRAGLWVLLGAVGCVLLIVCANLANLLLARAERRARESAVRAALGAGSGRLVREALIESGLVALLGGALGVAIATAGLGALIAAAPPEIPRLNEVRLDGWVLLFAFAITTATGLLFGLAPAWRAARANPQDALRAGGRATGGSRGGARLRTSLVAAEVGLSAALLVTAALLLASFGHLLRADKGFQAPLVLSADVQIPFEKYKTAEQRNAFHDRVLALLASKPGVASAGLVTALPLTGETWLDMASLPGDPRPPLERPMVNIRFASPDYFRSMGIPLRRGRSFSENDKKRSVAVISERAANLLWPGQDPIGREFETNGGKREVIGVAGDVLTDARRRDIAIVYRPYWEWAPPRVRYVARATAGDPRSLAGAILGAVRGADPDVPVPPLRTMREVLAESMAQRRFYMALASAFAVIALFLAALGIYGVVSYTVTRRTSEMGLRIALGARSLDIYAIVFRQAIPAVAVGLAAGVAGALAGGRVLKSLLYEVSPRDPAIVAAAAGVLLVVALAACSIPARRAARAAPLEALRSE